ncbi:MAG TPA: ABC transporter permease [Candidatus Acidoferrales bacterium]|nr:ABC transporter permease [Candidatus Acidoferrales bacterium]
MFADFGLVFAAEFMRRIRSRPYLLGTGIGVLMIGVFAVLPAFMDRGLSNSSKNIGVTGTSALRSQAEELLGADNFTIVDVDAAPSDVTRQFLQQHEKIAALVAIDKTQHGLRAIAYAEDPGTFPAARVARDLAPLNIALGTGIPTQLVAQLRAVRIDVRGVGGRFENASGAEATRGVTMFLVFILYLITLLNSQMLMASVAEEKTSRIAELLVASISPSALLGGKVLATGLAGILQLVIWSLTELFVGTKAGAIENAQMLVNAITPEIVVVFLIFFIVGFLEYSLLYAAAASLISRTEDLGSFTLPLVLPVIAAFFIAQFALEAPNGQTVVVTSFVPLLSPFVMFTRFMVTTIPLWQVGLAVLLNVAALAVIVPFAGKLYRVGLLLYGRTPKLSQIWAVLRT